MKIKALILFFSVFLFLGGNVSAQQNGSLRGQVLDTLNAVIVGATVTIADSEGKEKNVITNKDGEYNFAGLKPGKYTVRSTAKSFQSYENTEVEVTAGDRTELSIVMSVEIATEQVTVSNDTIGTDPDANVGATVLKEKDLEALPDDPDELAAALQALAGPGAGPNGGQLYIDGFTGGNMPPKESIREIRINQNPFSAEYERLGFGRIEILTKPGSDRLRGSAFMNFNDESLNSRNPFAQNRPSTQVRFFGGNFSMPIIKNRASFSVDFNRREGDDNAVINAKTLDAGFNIVPFQTAIATPVRRNNFNTRLDYAINEKNTLVARYSFNQSATPIVGLSEFTLPSRAFSFKSRDQNFQLTETMIISPTIVNETRFQYSRSNRGSEGDLSTPGINAAPDFLTGSSQVQSSYRDNRWELQNFTTWVSGKHSYKAGGRVRGVSLTDTSENNFGGTFTFTTTAVTAGDPFDLDANGFLTGIEKYRAKILGQAGDQYNPLQFAINTGEPAQRVSQTDFGGFFTDDWKYGPGLTLSFGLRYEVQTNIKDYSNFAPRFGFAWSPGAGGAKAPKTVFRGGVGIFYDRFGENFTLQERRLNGISQLQYQINNTNSPAERALLGQAVFTLNSVTNVPTTAQLAAIPQGTSNIRVIADDMHAPITYQSAFSVERQLPWNTNVSATYITTRINHMLRSRNVNAPTCPLLSICPEGSARPNSAIGRIDYYESSGNMTQHQMVVNFNTRLNPKITFFGNYRLGKTDGDTDGAGTFPAYSYDLSTEYGRSSWDVRHNFFFGGSYTAPWNIRLSPMIVASSGRPFNITTGIDGNRDGLLNDRPAFATDLGRQCDFGTPGNPRIRNCVVQTAYGNFDLQPVAGQTIIPRNYAEGPPSLNVNLNMNKTFSFGRSRNAAAQTAPQGGGQGGGRPGGGGGGNRGGGGGPQVTSTMGATMVQMGGGGGDKPYNLTFGVNVQNIFNIVNKNNPIGNLSSDRFGQSTGIGGAFGFFGGGGGNSGNRRVDLSLRFSF